VADDIPSDNGCKTAIAETGGLAPSHPAISPKTSLFCSCIEPPVGIPSSNDLRLTFGHTCVPQPARSLPSHSNKTQNLGIRTATSTAPKSIFRFAGSVPIRHPQAFRLPQVLCIRRGVDWSPPRSRPAYTFPFARRSPACECVTSTHSCRTSYSSTLSRLLGIVLLRQKREKNKRSDKPTQNSATVHQTNAV
jgi:hypothetical protein